MELSSYLCIAGRGVVLLGVLVRDTGGRGGDHVLGHLDQVDVDGAGREMELDCAGLSLLEL